jgi:polyadenylate-binding protein 2
MAGQVDLDAMRAKLEKLRELKCLKEEAIKPPETPTTIPAPPSDDNSVFIGSLDFSVKKEDLIAYFENCGEITRCTIQTDHYTHKPKGYAYIEFADLEGVENALKFDGHVLAGRNIQVRRKRQNTPSPRRRFRRC